MRDETYTALRDYLDRLGAAEYAQFRARQRRKSERYAPSAYHAELIRLLGADDEAGFKALRALQGYASALGH